MIIMMRCHISRCYGCCPDVIPLFQIAGVGRMKWQILSMEMLMNTVIVMGMLKMFQIFIDSIWRKFVS